jgi:HD-GYP domain-containing protein (c-di-GMP phosphodiesterase class II)
MVAVADIFDALRTIRPYRGALSEAQAVSIILQDLQRGALERGSVAALLGALGALEVGRRVDLPGGRRGTVIAPGESDALQPLVETDEGEIIDLSDAAAPPICGVRDEEELHTETGG